MVAMIMSTVIKFGIYIQGIEFGIIQQNTQQSFKLRVQILLPLLWFLWLFLLLWAGKEKDFWVLKWSPTS